MNMLFLLLLIPVYIISMVFNIGTSINIVINNDLNFFYYILSLCLMYILGLIILRLLEKSFNSSPFLKNISDNNVLICNFIMMVSCLLFGIALFINSFKYEMSIINISIATIIMIIAVYYICAFKEIIITQKLKLISIDDKDKYLDLLLFEDSKGNLFEYTSYKKDTYIENKTYLCKAISGNVYKIVKEYKGDINE